MSPLLRKGLTAFGVTALIAIPLGLYPRFFGRKRLRFTYLTGQLAPAEYRELASRPGWSATNVTVAPGIKLMGLVRRPSAKDAPWLVYYPGNDATQLRRGQAFLSRVGENRDWGLAVFGKKHPMMGQVVAARFKLKEPEALDAFKRRMMAFCRERMANYQLPRMVELTDAEQFGARFKKMRHE